MTRLLEMFFFLFFGVPIERTGLPTLVFNNGGIVVRHKSSRFVSSSLAVSLRKLPGPWRIWSGRRRATGFSCFYRSLRSIWDQEVFCRFLQKPDQEGVVKSSWHGWQFPRMVSLMSLKKTTEAVLTLHLILFHGNHCTSVRPRERFPSSVVLPQVFSFS